jgi:LPXTG-motif cell wall-anchored protein
MTHILGTHAARGAVLIAGATAAVAFAAPAFAAGNPTGTMTITPKTSTLQQGETETLNVTVKPSTGESGGTLSASLAQTTSGLSIKTMHTPNPDVMLVTVSAAAAAMPGDLGTVTATYVPPVAAVLHPDSPPENITATATVTVVAKPTPTPTPTKTPTPTPTATTPVATTPATTPTAPTTLPKTGASDTPLVAGSAAALLVAGAGAVVYSRRRARGSHS